MDGYVDAPENCNRCKFKQEMGRHWELEDYCFLNQKSISRNDTERLGWQDYFLGLQGSILM